MTDPTPLPPFKVPREPLAPRLAKPCSANVARAAVAATARRSATSGLCSSFMKASPASADLVEPLCRLRELLCRLLEPLLVRLFFVFLAAPLPAFVAFFAIGGSPRIGRSPV